MINKCTQFNEIIAQIKSDLKHVPSWQALQVFMKLGGDRVASRLWLNLDAGADGEHLVLTQEILDDFSTYENLSFTLTYGVVTGVQLSHVTGSQQDVLLLERLVQHPDAFLLTELSIIPTLEFFDDQKREIIDLAFLQSFPMFTRLHLCGIYFNNVGRLKHLTHVSARYCTYGGSNDALSEELSHLNNLQWLAIEIAMDDWELTVNEAWLTLSNLKCLKLVEVGLEDLTPLKSMVNLEVLDVSNNRLSDIRFLESLTQLKQLSIAGNQIKSIQPLAKLTKLEHLYVDGNRICDLSALSNLSQLKILNISRNQVTSLAPLSRLQQLQGLLLEQNQVSSVASLANLKRLEYLMLDENDTDTLEPLLACPALTKIIALFNPLTNIPQALLDRAVIVVWNGFCENLPKFQPDNDLKFYNEERLDKYRARLMLMMENVGCTTVPAGMAYIPRSLDDSFGAHDD